MHEPWIGTDSRGALVCVDGGQAKARLHILQHSIVNAFFTLSIPFRRFTRCTAFHALLSQAEREGTMKRGIIVATPPSFIMWVGLYLAVQSAVPFAHRHSIRAELHSIFSMGGSEFT